MNKSLHVSLPSNILGRAYKEHPGITGYLSRFLCIKIINNNSNVVT